MQLYEVSTTRHHRQATHPPPSLLQIARFNALADLYHQVGFQRKASFFRRVAAMRCVAPQNPQPDWGQCYRLLLQTLDGYKVCLDPLEFQKGKTTQLVASVSCTAILMLLQKTSQ